MSKWLFIVSLFALSACQLKSGYEQQRVEVLDLLFSENFDAPDSLDILSAQSLIDSLLQNPIHVRSWSDSLARMDSLDIGFLYAQRATMHYHWGDTLAATLVYLEAMPWLAALTPRAEVKEWKLYSETIGDAVLASKSPHIATLAWASFERAERLAAQLGDSTLAREVLLAKLNLNQKLYTLPDSTRLAFAPMPPASATPPFAGIGLAAVMAFVLGGGSLRFYQRRKAAKHNISTQHPPLADTTEAMLDALWMACNSVGEVPNAVLTVVDTTCRNTTSQRAMFMLAGLMTLAPDPTQVDPLKVANTVRSRLLRYFKRNQWEMGPGVLLPRDRAEWYQWFEVHGMGQQKPSIFLAQRHKASPRA